jgi:proteasome lid subunit RPN8/RPN11
MELLRKDGVPIGHAALAPDWEPALEWTRLSGLRTLGVWAPEAAAERPLEPLWHAELGEPYMRGFRIHLAGRDDEAWHEDFTLAYFGGLARVAAGQLIEQGALGADEGFLYRALAYAQPGADHGGPPPTAFAVVDQPPRLAIRDASREALEARSAPAGDTHADDFEVFIPAHVLEEASALTAAAGDVETGGILIGHIERDPQGPDVFVEITALIQARHTVGAATKLTFTSDTWTDVRGAVALRHRDEQVLGWYHSHPQDTWCRERGCPPDQQQRCTAADGFFSDDDLALHRTMFPRAFTVALVMTRSIKGVMPRLFGWRAGAFVPRGYRVLAHA